MGETLHALVFYNTSSTPDNIVTIRNRKMLYCNVIITAASSVFASVESPSLTPNLKNSAKQATMGIQLSRDNSWQPMSF